MLNVMILTAASSSPAQPFNADFYVAAATVIPILFLAIAVQGDAYRGLIDRAIARDTASVYARRLDRKMSNFLAGIALAVVASLMVFLGVLGEMIALFALATRQANDFIVFFTFFSAAYLTLAVAAGPLAGFLRYMANYPPDRAASRRPGH